MARAFMALVLFACSLGGLAVTSYADQYVNGGVTWGPPSANAPKIEHADVNPMGVNLALEKEVDPTKIERTLQMVREGGFKWARQGFAWNDIEISAKGNYTDTRNFVVVNAWDKYDRIVDAYQRYGIEIIARLDSPPLWARIPGDDVQQFHKGPPAHNEDYGDFVNAVASRYKGKIKYFQIWNEPNLWGEWGGYSVNAEEYTALLKVAHDRIKEANPDAVIITAALAPTADNSLKNLNDVLYLEWMYRAGAAPYFDILSTMLYGLGQSPEERRTDLKRLNFSRPILLRHVMERNGDEHKPIWISEYAWISIPPDFKGDPGRNIWGQSVDEATQARYLVEGYERAQKEWPWMGVMNVWYFREPDPDPLDPADYFAIVRPDFIPRPAYEMLKDYSNRRYTAASDPVVVEDHRRLPRTVGQFEDTLNFTGARLDAICSCKYDFFVSTVDGRELPHYPTEDFYAEGSNEKQSVILAKGLADGAHTLTVRMWTEGTEAEFEAANYAALVDRGHADAFPEKPLWNAWGFPILYGLFGLFALASAGLGASSLGRWAEAALNRPRGRYSEAIRETARNGAAVVGMALLVGIYYRVNSVPLMLAALAGWWVIAVLKPSLGLAAVAFSIPFFWVQKVVGEQHFPPEETLLVLLFAAVVARGLIGYLLPGLAAKLGVEPPRRQERQEPAKIIVDETQRRRDAEADENVVEIQADESGSPEGTIYRAPTGWRALWARFQGWSRAEPFGPPAVALLLVGTLSLFTLADPAYARDSFRLYRWAIVLPVLFYFLLADVIRSRRGLLRVADFFVGAAVVVSLLGLWQFVQDTNVLDVQGVSRIKSVYQHPNNLAIYLGRVAPFVGCMVLFLPWGWRKAAYALAALPIGATLLLTFSRGAWLAVVVAMAAGLVVAWRWGGARFVLWSRLPGRVRIGMVIGLLAVIMAGAVVVVPTLADRIFNVHSLSMRVLHWKSALKMIRDYPITGVGIDQFSNQFQRPDYKYREKEQDRELYTAHPHNFVLDYWVSLGIIGLFVLVWLLWRYFRVAVARVKQKAQEGDRVGKALALGLLASMVVFLVHGMVDNSYFLMDLASLFWLSCGMLHVMRET
ncbi:MAG TPA: O-antigen ligase family protein [Chloroflexia bacterium]|nr:O-antigen ligase family protein [Chloroflexia bacterium]